MTMPDVLLEAFVQTPFLLAFVVFGYLGLRLMRQENENWREDVRESNQRLEAVVTNLEAERDKRDDKLAETMEKGNAQWVTALEKHTNAIERLTMLVIAKNGSTREQAYATMSQEVAMQPQMQRLDTGHRREIVLELLRNGEDVPDIAERVGYSKSTIYRDRQYWIEEGKLAA